MTREGMTLPSLESRWAREQAKLFGEVFRRERRTKTEVMRFAINALYVMAGVSEMVTAKARFSTIKPFQERAEAHIQEEAYSVVHHKKTIERRIRELQREKDLFDRITLITSGELTLSDWIKGK